MIIGKPSDSVSAQPVTRTGGSGAGRVNPAVASDAPIEGVQPADSVKLSNAGRALSAGGKGADEVRAEKVAAVKKAVDDGTYRVRADAVADRMISDAAEMLGAMRSGR